MVGMSGKSNEPRGGGTSGNIQHSKKLQSGSSHTKTQPPVEALQFALILDESSKTLSMPDLESRIQQVLAIVPGRTLEEANVALHDNDFNVATAVSALLDNDSGMGTGEWTTTARKGKKKDGRADTDLIAAPGDSKTPNNKSSRSSRSTNRAAATTTREGFGGSVTVTTPGDSSRGTSKGTRNTPQSGRGHDGRGRSQSGRRPNDRTKGPSSDKRREKAGDRSDRERGDRERGDRGDRGDRERGDRERGDRERGDRERGDRERGDRERGDRERGDRERGDRERGDRERGDRERGDRGDRERGDRGDRDRGERGDRERGDRRGERRDRGDRERGGGFGRNKGRSKHNHSSRTFGSGEPGWNNVVSPLNVGGVPAASVVITSSSLHGHEALGQFPPSTTSTTTTTDITSWDTEAWPPTNTSALEAKVESNLWADDEEDSLSHDATTPLFPDALPPPPSPHQTHPQLAALSTAAETTPPDLMSVGGGSDRGFLQLQASEQRQDDSLAGEQKGRGGASNKKPKRLARSRIPSKPLEMPGGVDTLDLEFGQLGIDFIGSEQESRTTPTSAGPPAGFTSPTDRRVLYSTEVQRIAEDPSVLSVVSTPSNQSLPLEAPGGEVGGAQYGHHGLEQAKGGGGRMETVMTKDALLDGPPGLTRPASVSTGRDTTEGSPLSTSSQQQQQSHALQQPTSSATPTVVKSLGMGGDTPMSVSSGNVPLPDPIEMPRQQTQIQSSHSQGHYPVTSSNSELLMSAVASTSSAVNLASSVGVATGAPSSSTYLRNQQQQHTSMTSSSQHSNVPQQTAGKPVPPGLMYPHMNMMPAQYPFMPMYTPNYADPSEMSRYPVSMAYYQPSSDPTMVAAMARGDHSTSTFASADQAKFTRSAADGTSPATSQPQTQQGTGLQQGQHMATPFMNYPAAAYGFYPTMYPMPAGFSAAHTLAPKPSAGASNISSYQHHQSGGFNAYDDMLSSAGPSTSHDQFTGAGKMYGSSSLSKSNTLPTSSTQEAGLGAGPAGSSTSYKQHAYDGSKSTSASGGYNYSAIPGNQGYIGTYMGMTTIPMHHHMPTGATQVLQGGGTHDTAGGISRGAIPSGQPMQKHNTKNMSGYQQSAYWPPQGHS